MNRTDEIYRISNKINKIKDKAEYMLDIISNNQKIDKENLFVKVSNNVGIILNDKINEISKYFKDNNMDFYGESTIKYIIENELMKKANDSLNILSKYFLELNIYSERRLKDSNFFGFRSKKKKKLDKEIISSMNKIIEDYENTINIIKSYNFKDSVINNIIDFIDRKGYEWYKKNIGTIETFENELDMLDCNDLVFDLEKTVKDKGYFDILPNSNYILTKNKRESNTLDKADIIVMYNKKASNKEKIENLKMIKIDINESKDKVENSYNKKNA